MPGAYKPPKAVQLSGPIYNPNPSLNTFHIRKVMPYYLKLYNYGNGVAKDFQDLP